MSLALVVKGYGGRDRGRDGETEDGDRALHNQAEC